MPTPFDPLRTRLRQQGIARRHIDRYLAELADHIDDIVAAELARGVPPEAALRTAQARLGQVDDLAGAMAAHPRLRSWVARAPWAVLPGAALLSLMAAYLLVGVAIAACVARFGIPQAGHLMPPGWLPGIADRLFLLTRLIAPTLTAWTLWFLAMHRGVRPLWPLVAIVLTALVAAGMVYTVDWPSTPRTWDINLRWAVSTDGDDGMSAAAYGRTVAVILLLSLVPQICARWWQVHWGRE